MVPHLERCDVRLAALAARSYYGQLLRGGVRIHEFEPSMLHTKALVVDGTLAFVGSANVDIRSFQHNFEIGALVQDPEFVGEVERRFERDLARSHAVTLEELECARLGTRVQCGVARLLSPIL